MTNKVPAFESAIGLAPPDAVQVDATALATVNEEMTRDRSAIQRYSREAAAVASLFAARAVRPDEIAALRRKMFDLVEKRMKDVDEVFEGKRKWGNVEVRLMSLLVERVLPKLTNVKVEDATSRKIDDLSVEELERIALNQRKREAVDAVVTAGEVLEEDAEKQERRAAKKELLRQLAEIDAIDEAEKEFIAEQIAKPLEAVDRKEKAGGRAKGAHLTKEQKEKMLAKNRRSNVQRWMDQGMSREEAEAKQRAAVAKAQARRDALREAKEIRMGLTNGLGEAAKVAKNIVEKRSQTMKAFRVNPLKGVRKPTTLIKEKLEAEKKAAKRKEKEENPRVRIGRVIKDKLPPGIDPEKVRLRDIREHAPEVLEPKPYDWTPE